MEGVCTSVPEVEELGWAAGSRVAVVGVAVGVGVAAVVVAAAKASQTYRRPATGGPSWRAPG